MTRKLQLRVLAIAFAVAGATCLFMALGGSGGGRVATASARPVGAELACRLHVREKLISGAYKVYGLKDQPVGVWLSKAVFRNDTGGVIRDLKVRYKLGQYADWCSWQTYPEMVPTQTAVDLYHPILSSDCARLASRTPAELQMEYQYRDPGGALRTFQRSERLTVLSQREFYFTNLSAQERTDSFQDVLTNGPLLAAWVTPADTPVTGLAALANKQAQGAGALIRDENCLAVMRELYEIMRTIRITYQSYAHQHEKDKSFDIMLVQTLQYPRDTIRTRSGTCIDLAALYAAMMQAVGIKPLLVLMDGHCFPMGVTPSGRQVPVEVTCVGGGGRNSGDFQLAVKLAQEQWQKLQQNKRFVVVDCRECWGAGISPPELEPLPADILDRWKITEQVGGAEAAQPAAQAPAAAAAPVLCPPAPAPQAAAALAAGAWGFALTLPTGTTVGGDAQVTVSGNQVQIIFLLAYQVAGHDGQPHQAREQNTFVGATDGRQLLAQCRQAVWTLDGQALPPQGLPYTLNLALATTGRAAQGTVSNALGIASRIVMQAK